MARGDRIPARWDPRREESLSRKQGWAGLDGQKLLAGMSSRRARSRFARKFSEPVEKRPLAFQNFRVSGRQVEPLGAINFREYLNFSALGRPFDFETVACYRGNVEIAFDRESNHPLAAALTNLAKRFKRPGDSSAGFFRKFPTGGDGGILACVDFAFRDRPGAFILAAPVRSARMHQQDFKLRSDAQIP